MTDEIAGPDGGAPNGNLLKPDLRQQGSRKLLATTFFNLSIIAVLTMAVMPANGIVPAVGLLVVYFIPVLLATLLWDFEQGMIAAFASALFAEFCLLKPLYSFSVDDENDLIALLIFLAAALLLYIWWTRFAACAKSLATLPLVGQRCSATPQRNGPHPIGPRLILPAKHGPCRNVSPNFWSVTSTRCIATSAFKISSA